MIVSRAHRYRWASGLQKALRRGHVELAGELAAGLAEAAGTAYAHYRLGECAAEDKLASPEDACAIVLGGRDPSVRRELGEVGTVRQMAMQLAALPSSRIADALYLSAQAIELTVLTDELKTAPPSDVIAMAISSTAAWRMRLGAWRALSGRREYEEAVDAMQLGSAVSTMATMARAGSLGESLPLSTSIIAASYGELITTEIEPEPTVSGLLSSAFDSHVGEFWRIGGYFVACVPKLKQFFVDRPHVKKSACLGWSVFTTEGALTACSLTSETIREVESYARQTFVAQLGLSESEFTELEDLIRSHMPLLHKARAKIVTAVDQEATEKAIRESAERELPL